MNKEEILKETRQKLEEINNRAQVMRDKILRNPDESTQKKAQALLDKLEDSRSKLETEYNKFMDSESEKESDVTEFEKNIYTGIESFEDAFTQAGLLFKTNE